MDQQRPKSGASTPVTSWSSTVFLTNGTRYVTNGAPDGSRSLSTYSSGRLISNVRKDALGNQLAAATYTYDPHGRQLAVSDARVGATTYAYNAADQVASVTTPAPVLGQAAQITRTYYNKLLQATNVVEPDSSSVFTEFYLTGELKRNYGSRTYPVEYTYDYAGRVQTMKTWQNFASDSGAAVTTWNYSTSRGWLSSKRYANAGQGSLGPDYTYTPGGRLKTRTWARGVVTTYGYGFDDANSGNDYPELVQVDYTSDPQATPSITYTYDRRGRQATVVQSPTTVGLTYNLAGELTQENYTGGPLNGLSVTNGYDHWMRRTNVVLRSGGSSLHAASYYYDEASRLRRVASGSASAGYSYLANSPLVSQIAFTNSGVQRMVTTRQYDLLNRLENIKSVPSGSGAASFAYTYNSANQRTLRREADGSYWRYEYDSLGQVVSGNKYWADGTPVAGQQFQYAFDDIGNRVSTKAGGDEYGANLRTNAYYPNLLNQYTSRTIPGAADVIGVSLATNTVTVNGLVPYRKGEYFRKELTVANSSTPVWQAITVAATGQTSVSGNVLVPKANESFWHDADGNLLSDSLWTNIWNGENRLVALESAAGMPTGAKMREVWKHLPDGRWIERIVSTNNGSAYYPAYTNRFVWDGQVLLAILDHNNGLVMSFVRGLDLSGSLQGAGGVGGVVAVAFKTNGTHFVSYDGNGNVAALTDSGSGTNSATYEYGPFSEPIRVTGALANQMPLRFSTMYEDSVTADRKYLFRDYNPSAGRWKSRDPIEEQGGSNLFGVVGNNATTYFDHLGLAFYAVDGTWTDSSGGANPRQLYLETKESPSWYWRGPKGPKGLVGWDSMSIALSVFNQIEHDFCEARHAGTNLTINLTGWSRGAMIAAYVAELLKSGCWCLECGNLQRYVPVQVNWVGLFDAVGMTTGITFPRPVPSNVAHFDHAIKTQQDGWQSIFPTWHFSGGTERAFNNYDGSLTTHADIGMSVILGNHNGAYPWIKNQAVAAGVAF